MIGAAFGLGFIFGPAIGGVLSKNGYSVPAYVACGLALVAAVLAVFVLPESLPKAKRAEAIAMRRAAPTLVHALQRPTVGLVLALFFIGTLAFSMLEGTFALIGEHSYSLGPREIGYFFAFVGLVGAIMQAGIVGMLAKRFGERALIVGGFCLMTIGLGISGTLPVFGVLVALMGVVSMGSGMTTPSLAGLISVSSTAEEQGGILGVYQSLGSLARAAGPLLGGVAFDRLGHGSPLLTGGLLMGLGAVMAFKLPRRRPSPSTA